MSQIFSPFNPKSTTEQPPKLSQENEQEALFSQRANSAWGAAFVTTEAVSAATDAVADGFAELFQTLDDGTPVTDSHFEILRMTHNAAVRLLQSGPGGQHSREPVSLLGETKDRQATLALTALGEPLRSILWLIDAERLTVEQTSTIMRSSNTEVTQAIRQARAQFRRYYVDATRRDGLNSACIETLDLLAGYGNQSLTPDEITTVDAHLTNCDSCRNIVTKLTDLESRLHSAIPSIPAWTRQYVMDTWDAISNSTALRATPIKNFHGSKTLRSFATAAAACVVIGAIIIALIYPSDNKKATHETASSQLPVPANASTHTTIPFDDQATVPTPVFETHAVSTSPDAINPAANATANSSASKNKNPTTTTLAITSTTATVQTSATQPPVDNRLVDLPPATTTTAPTTTTMPSESSDRSQH